MPASLHTVADAPTPRSTELRVEIPGDPAHVRVARLVATDAAGRAGFDCDDADDLRIAVDEMCHTLITNLTGDLTLRFAIAPRRVDVLVSTRPRGSIRPLALHELSKLILDAVTDSFELVETPAELQIAVSKTATGEPRR
jgi:hypothetical protein